jgi:hypothetical protein
MGDGVSERRGIGTKEISPMDLQALGAILRGEIHITGIGSAHDSNLTSTSSSSTIKLDRVN